MLPALDVAGVFPRWYPDKWLTEDDNPQNNNMEAWPVPGGDYRDLSGTLPGQSSGWKLAPAWLQNKPVAALLYFKLQGQRNLQKTHGVWFPGCEELAAWKFDSQSIKNCNVWPFFFFQCTLIMHYIWSVIETLQYHLFIQQKLLRAFIKMCSPWYFHFITCVHCATMFSYLHRNKWTCTQSWSCSPLVCRPVHTCEVLPSVYLSIAFSETLPTGFDRWLCGLKVQLPTVMTLYSLAGL